LRDKFDEDIKIIKEELDMKYKKEIEDFKNNIKVENKSEYNQVNDNNKILENDYYNDINDIKKRNKDNEKKLNDIVKNIIEKTSNSFEQIKKKELNDINEVFAEIIQKIKQTIQKENNEEKSGGLIEDYISELIADKKLVLNKNNSYVNMAEDEYKQSNILLLYFIDIIKLIKNKITENSSKLNINDDINDELLIKEIIRDVGFYMENYRQKYEDEKNIKLYPALFDALQKIMNLIFNDENTNDIIENSIYSKPFLNSNISHNITNNLINNSLMEQNVNNNNINLKTIRTIYTINPNLNNSSLEDISINNPSVSNIQRQNQFQNIVSPASSSSFSPGTKNHSTNNISVLNRTFSNTVRPRYNINNMQPINEESELNSEERNINNININIPQLPDEIVNTFSIENLNNYKTIINFLISESRNILKEQDSYIDKKNAYNKLNQFKESGEFSQYNNILEQICKQEDSRANQYLKDIQSKLNIFEMIQKNCKENFDFILKYYNRNNVVNNKLGVLITHIDDYYKYLKSKKNNNINAFKRIDDNIENILNNTFTIDRRSDRLYNFNNNENILNNTINNENSNIRKNINNVSFLNHNNNRLYNQNYSDVSKSSTFNRKLFNSYSHF
jgi:hypothetical protein